MTNDQRKGLVQLLEKEARRIQARNWWESPLRKKVKAELDAKHHVAKLQEAEDAAVSVRRTAEKKVEQEITAVEHQFHQEKALELDRVMKAQARILQADSVEDAQRALAEYGFHF